MSEIVKFLREIYEASKERFKTPLTKNYIYFLLAWNWKTIYYLIFSNEIAETKLMYLNIHQSYKNYLIPAVLTIVYILGIDFVMNFIEIKLKKVKDSRIKNYYDSETFKAEESERLARAEFNRELAKTGSETIADLNERNEDLESELQSSIKKIDELNESLMNQKNESNIVLDEYNKLLVKSKNLEREVATVESIKQSLNSDIDFNGLISVVNNQLVKISRIKANAFLEYFNQAGKEKLIDVKDNFKLYKAIYNKYADSDPKVIIHTKEITDEILKFNVIRELLRLEVLMNYDKDIRFTPEGELLYKVFVE